MVHPYTPQEVAETLNTTEVCLFMWRRDGVGPPWHKRNSRIFYPVDAFQEYLDKVGDIPADMTPYQRGRFFQPVHGSRTKASAKTRKAAAESAAKARKADARKPTIDPAIVVGLVNRVAALEKVVVRMMADQTEAKLTASAPQEAVTQEKPKRQKPKRGSGARVRRIIQAIPY